LTGFLRIYMSILRNPVNPVLSHSEMEEITPLTV
jgi:hypothetical protein